MPGLNSLEKTDGKESKIQGSKRVAGLKKRENEMDGLQFHPAGG